MACEIVSNPLKCRLTNLESSFGGHQRGSRARARAWSEHKSLFFLRMSVYKRDIVSKIVRFAVRKGVVAHRCLQNSQFELQT